MTTASTPAARSPWLGLVLVGFLAVLAAGFTVRSWTKSTIARHRARAAAVLATQDSGARHEALWGFMKSGIIENLPDCSGGYLRTGLAFAAADKTVKESVAKLAFDYCQRKDATIKMVLIESADDVIVGHVNSQGAELQ
jgi:hypothetical protein